MVVPYQTQRNHLDTKQRTGNGEWGPFSLGRKHHGNIYSFTEVNRMTEMYIKTYCFIYTCLLGPSVRKRLLA